MANDEKLREALEKIDRHMAILINENIEVLTVTVQHHITAAQKTIREALSALQDDGK